MVGLDGVHRNLVYSAHHGVAIRWRGPPSFTDKSQEKQLERVKRKFGTHRAARGLYVASINDDAVIFVTQVLSCKLLRKCQLYYFICDSN